MCAFRMRRISRSGKRMLLRCSYSVVRETAIDIKKKKSLTWLFFCF